MKSVWMGGFVLLMAAGVLGQQGGNVFYQTAGVGVGGFAAGPVAPVTGAPYSATTTSEMTQTLEDGTHIVQKATGSVARDSQGRTRQDAPLPVIGSLAAANPPHIVFLEDPVAQVSYTLNLTEKTAQKIIFAPGSVSAVAGKTGASPVMVMAFADGPATASTGAVAPPLPGPASVVLQKALVTEDPTQTTTEDLGSQTMEGVTVTGARTTRIIPAGQVGNDAPIRVVTEVWTSPELRIIVYSKRSDPRMGTQVFSLTDVVRAEPDTSLFTVPADFKLVDGPQPIVYRTKQ